MKRTPPGMNDDRRFHSLSGMSLYGDLRSVALRERGYLDSAGEFDFRPSPPGAEALGYTHKGG